MTDKIPITISIRLDRKAINARLDLIAYERGLAPSEVEAAKRSEEELVWFALRHGLSIDWLVEGDLRGRLRMARRG
jgi:hypothetical protein